MVKYTSSGYIVGLSVKSSKSQEETEKFLESFVDALRKVCASQDGCPGVSLSDNIIWAEASSELCACCMKDQIIGSKADKTPKYEHSYDLSSQLSSKAGEIPKLDFSDDLSQLSSKAGEIPKLDFSDDLSQLSGKAEEVPTYEHSWDEVVVDAEKDSAGFHLGGEAWPQYANKNRQLGKRRGLAVVINVEGEARPGAHLDRERLVKLFRSRGFDVRLEVNKTAKELQQLIKDIGKYVRAEDECFICSINAHGGTMEGAQYIHESTEDSAHLWVLNDFVVPISRCPILEVWPTRGAKEKRFIT
eukprot:TRINITY_DN748_c0_g1_i7.p1 TRINITY_DN748_c0_g1~~TRINITY_DN748_c0_g1_i7.p1  ORF type:complete len:302 (+),score=46.85 TRINITY_DN748_c0_g1_i7:840-1745(+)